VAEVRRRIHARDWPPGAVIPGEMALAAEFGVARATVNRALQALADDGWLDRRRRAGTRVALHPVRRATLHIPILRAEVEGRGAVYAHRLLGQQMVAAPASVTTALKLPAGKPLLHLPALHLADAVPHAHEERWVNPDAVPGILTADLDRFSANEWLVANAPFTHGDYAISAGPAPGDVAGHLRAPVGAAVLSVTRTTWDGVRPITWVRLTYPPGHRISAQL
jgi:GntR family transcriptional regulator, histidine utilization repressor